MGVVLPGELVWVLDLIGVDWPNVDEDDYRQMADSLRSFAEECDNGTADTQQAVQRMLGENEGAAVEAFEAHWSKVAGTHLPQLAEGCRVGATVLDAIAVVIEGAKVAAIAQLGVLAAEVIAAQAAAVDTLGASEAAAAAATQVTRVVVKQLLQEAEQQIVSQLTSVVEGPIIAAVEGVANQLVLNLGGSAVAA